MMFIFPTMTLCSVYSGVYLVGHQNDLCYHYCFEMQAFFQSLQASSQVVHFLTSAPWFGWKNNGVMQTEL